MANAKEAAQAILTYIVLPAAFLFLIYKIITDILLAPLRSTEELWKKQYDEYVRELMEYSEQTGGNLTADQKQILDGKVKLMQQTEATWAQIAAGIYGTIERMAEVALGVAVTILALKYAPDIIEKWKKLFEKDRMGTATGQAYAAVMCQIESMAAAGKITEASVLRTVMENYFNTVDAPAMQQAITQYQQQLTQLTGWQYLYALYMINWLQIELNSIPAWFAALPPLPPPP